MPPGEAPPDPTAAAVSGGVEEPAAGGEEAAEREEEDAEGGFCSVCLNGDGAADNAVVACDGCGMSVHQVARRRRRHRPRHRHPPSAPRWGCFTGRRGRAAAAGWRP